ncbi:MAG: M20/M25/M40 family metallo-hydrolase, partial [Porticoccus sp.]
MLQRLIASNSISSVNPTLDQGNREVIELLAGWLNDLGFTTEIMPLADQRKANLIATLGTGSGGLVLAGHTDTVPCDEKLWNSNPFDLIEKDQRLYGLGTCDMKGFFPLAIEAAKPFLNQPLQQPLIILAT